MPFLFLWLLHESSHQLVQHGSGQAVARPQKEMPTITDLGNQKTEAPTAPRR